MLPSEDALWVGEELTRRFGVAVLAVRAHRDRREPLRDPARAPRHRPAEDPRLQLVLPRHRRRDLRDARRRRRRSRAARQPRPAGRSGRDDPRRRVQRRRRARARARAAATSRCVLAEPALTNIGIVHPEPGFHDALRELTRAHGTLLAIDETHTICCGPGGYTQAHGLEPDVVTIGKPIAGGIPAAAYGFSRGGGRAPRRSDRARRRRRRRRRRHARRQRALARRDARDARRRADRGGVRAHDRRSPSAGRPASRRASTASGLPWHVRSSAAAPSTSSRPTAPERSGGARRGRRRARALPAPLRAESRHPADAVPQHGAHVAGDDRGGRRSHTDVFRRPSSSWRSSRAPTGSRRPRRPWRVTRLLARCRLALSQRRHIDDARGDALELTASSSPNASLGQTASKSAAGSRHVRPRRGRGT